MAGKRFEVREVPCIADQKSIYMKYIRRLDVSGVREEQDGYRKRVAQPSESAPRLSPEGARAFTAKVFKSGNSLALRLPAELGFTAGVEMRLVAEDDGRFSFEPIGRPRRKLNVDAFWGSATGLKLIAPEDRVFEERKLDWSGDRLNRDG